MRTIGTKDSLEQPFRMTRVWKNDGNTHDLCTHSLSSRVDRKDHSPTNSCHVERWNFIFELIWANSLCKQLWLWGWPTSHGLGQSLVGTCTPWEQDQDKVRSRQDQRLQRSNQLEANRWSVLISGRPFWWFMLIFIGTDPIILSYGLMSIPNWLTCSWGVVVTQIQHKRSAGLSPPPTQCPQFPNQPEFCGKFKTTESFRIDLM